MTYLKITLLLTPLLLCLVFLLSSEPQQQPDPLYEDLAAANVRWNRYRQTMHKELEEDVQLQKQHQEGREREMKQIYQHYKRTPPHVVPLLPK